MTKMWMKRDEWVTYAPCGEDIDFIIAPEVLGRKRTARVKSVCASCPVRPECIKRNCVEHQANTVWVAGQWIPDHYTAASRREAEAARAALRVSIHDEEEARPEGLL